jgi:hypothetical protein
MTANNRKLLQLVKDLSQNIKDEVKSPKLKPEEIEIEKEKLKIPKILFNKFLINNQENKISSKNKKILNQTGHSFYQYNNIERDSTPSPIARFNMNNYNFTPIINNDSSRNHNPQTNLLLNNSTKDINSNTKNLTNDKTQSTYYHSNKKEINRKGKTILDQFDQMINKSNIMNKKSIIKLGSIVS